MLDLGKAYQRVIKWTDRDEETGCLISLYSVGSHGYAQAWNGQTVVLAHRVVWEWNHGPIEKGMTVDHICHVRKCVEINHLRLLTNQANAEDNGQVWINDVTGTKCALGHPMVRSPGSRKTYCRDCNNRRRRARRATGKKN